MSIPERDGDGYLADMSLWTPEIGRAMAEADGFEMDDEKSRIARNTQLFLQNETKYNHQ